MPSNFSQSIFFFLAVSVLGMSSCSRTPACRFIPHEHTLFIAMPDSPLVHQNYAPLLYDSLWDRFSARGYGLATSPGDHHSLQVTIKRVATTHRYISPDVVPYGYRISVLLEARILSGKTVLTSHDFESSSIVNTSREPRLRMRFIEFELEAIMKRLASRIDYWVRPHLSRLREEHDEN